MKKITTLILLAIIIAGCNSSGKDTNKDKETDKGWTSTEKKKFIADCAQTASKSMTDYQAQSYCTCMEGKLEIKYASYADMNKMKPEDMKTPEMQRVIEDCLRHPWTSEEREKFITDCEQTARSRMTPDKASSYCKCMEGKVETKYPTYLDANKMTDADLNTPEMKKLINDCLK